MEKEQAFRRVVEQIFNNWTALRLAVEHDFGGQQSSNRFSALDCLEFIVDFCINKKPNIDVYGIQDELDDLMNDEYDTVCEDGSTQEIAILFHQFLQLIKDGNSVGYEELFAKLPTISNQWLVASESVIPDEADIPATQQSHQSIKEAEQPIDDEPMEEEDPGWVQVRPRRRR